MRRHSPCRRRCQSERSRLRVASAARSSVASCQKKASATPRRNADGRWRIGSAQVELLLAEPAAGYQQLPRILEQFENFCIVTQSVRDGVDVHVTVRDGTGAIVHGGAAVGAQT